MNARNDFRPYGSELPEGVKHLHGALYLVKLDLLALPDPEAAEGQANKYEFKNPRSLTEKGQNDLFDKLKNAHLRDSIKEKTLMSPFICRWQKNGDSLAIQMVGGERRHRAISFLVKKKELVKDPESARLNDLLEYEYDYLPADKVYEFVLCQIYSCKDDLDALSLAYTENDCRVNQGPGHDIAMVMEMRRFGATDERIMSTMSKDEKWLRDSDHLINNLTPEWLKDLTEDRIDREAALEIISLKEKHGEELANKALQVAHTASQRDYKKKFEQLTSQIGDARDEAEIAEGSVVEAQYKQNIDAEEKAQATVEAAKAKVKRLSQQRQSTKATTNKKQVRDGLRIVNGDDPRPTTLRAPKINECYVEPLEKLLQAGGRNVEDEYVASADALNLGIKLCKGIMAGDKDCMEIVRLHCKNLSNNIPPLQDEEEEEDDDDGNE